MGLIGWIQKKQEDLRIKINSVQFPLAQPSATAPTPGESIGIKLDPVRQKIEDQKFQEIAQGTIDDIKAGGFFKPEKFPDIETRIKKITRPGYGYTDIFASDDCLSLEEKKALGLNTRKKFSREFVDALTPAGLTHDDPKSIIENVFYQNYHKAHRKYSLLEMKKLGIKKVEIDDCGDGADCAAVKKIKKVWPIDQVPELPLPGCDARYCRCSYMSVLE